MAAEKKAAIDPDDISDKRLDEITAADFLKALHEGGISAGYALGGWPEKKKYELHVEPENLGGVRYKDLATLFVREKKKVELEKHPMMEGFQKAVPRETWQDPRDFLRDPEVITAIAREVANQLRYIR
jgi:hypothetical protein